MIRAKLHPGMGFLKRFLGGESQQETTPSQAQHVSVSATLFTGSETLEVVGESNYQRALWNAVGGRTREYVRERVVAALVPEPDNAYDSNAGSVQVGGDVVGYLSRDDAALYLPGITRHMEANSTYVALEGSIAGGGERADGIGMLGLFLDHDPADFGIVRKMPETHHGSVGGQIDTGFTEAWQSDLEDDAYDLSWAADLEPKQIVRRFSSYASYW